MCYRIAVIALALLMPLLTPAASAQENAAPAKTPDYWSDRWRGWHFYEDPEPKAEPAPSPKSIPQPHTSRPTKVPELILFEQLQKRLEETRNIAIINPTDFNVRRYMDLEAKVVAQASYFADVAQRVAWATPELDPTVQGRPVNAKALEVFDREQSSARARSVAELGRDHVLIFFFRSDCPYCHAFSPTLEAFQARYGINVMPVSLDGGGMPDFPNPRRDNGISRTLNVTQVPAVFLAEPFTGKITPIGFGVLSESQLLERITAVSTPSEAAMVPSAIRRIDLR